MATILVVEDEVLIAMLIADAIADAGHTIAGPYNTVPAALAVVEREPIDAAILDINLGRNGYSYPVAAALARRAVPFAFLTGYARASVDPAFRAVPLLQKPVAGHVLAELIAALVAPRTHTP